MPHLIHATPISWHRAPLFVIVGVGAPSSAVGLRRPRSFLECDGMDVKLHNVPPIQD